MDDIENNGETPRSANPRRIDHAVFPVADLDVARARYSALGFTVAPVGRHPFGTENACIFLADGFFVEPLAIAHRETCEAAAMRGNAFVARDQAWRFRNGLEGFSGLALDTDDAAADHEQFRRAGFPGGRMLEFSRPFLRPDGARGLAQFRLAFSADLRSPDAFVFTCQRIGAVAGGCGSLAEHANGVTGLAAVVAVESNPSDFQYLLQETLRQREVRAHSFGIDLEADGARLSVLTTEGVRSLYGSLAEAWQRGLRFQGLVLNCRSLSALRALLQANGVAWREYGGMIVVDPAPGQGAFLAFGETQ